MPMAVISAVSRGALRRRSGRYATRSMTRAAPPDVSMAAPMTIVIVKTRLMPVRLSSTPMPWMVNVAANTPMAKISECAKLIRRSTP